MKVYLYELSEDPKFLHFTEKETWVAEAVEQTQEAPLRPGGPPPAYSVDFELRKLQNIVILKGKMALTLGLLCSRCATPFDYKIHSGYSCMFTKDDELFEKGNVGVAHSEPTGAKPEDLEMELLEKDYIELEDVLKEQIYLKIPFQPLCKEDCKGICATCGQDQNLQPCQCHRLKNSALANALRKLL